MQFGLQKGITENTITVVSYSKRFLSSDAAHCINQISCEENEYLCYVIFKGVEIYLFWCDLENFSTVMCTIIIQYQGIIVKHLYTIQVWWGGGDAGCPFSMVITYQKNSLCRRYWLLFALTTHSRNRELWTCRYSWLSINMLWNCRHCQLLQYY